MTREYGWGLLGRRVVGQVPRNRGRVLTVVGAIALDGVRALMAYEGGTTKEAFLRFVHEALAPSLHQGDVVVMDNLGAHRANGVVEAIRAAGADVLFLPPYGIGLVLLEAVTGIEPLWDELLLTDLPSATLLIERESSRGGAVGLWTERRGSRGVA